jgi:CHASE1-domain containing sensor protein
MALPVASGRSGVTAGAVGSPPSLLESLRRAWPAYVVLGCTLLLTFGAWRYALRTVRADEQERFARVVAASEEAIDRRFDSYVQILLGVRALFAGSGDVERSEFRSYVATLELEGRYQGIRGIGWAPRVPAAQRARHEVALRRQGLPAYEIHPVTDAPEAFPVVFAAPAEGFADRVFGLDVMSRPENRPALERARDRGEPAMGERVRLLRDEGGVGFVIFVPVYRGGRVPASVEERRRDLEGFVSASLRPDLMLQILFASPLAEPVDLEVYDGIDRRPERLLYDRDRGAGPGDVPRELGRWLPLVLGGHTWTLHVATLPAFHSRPERLIPPAVLGSGLLISVLAFVITLLQTHALLRARRMGSEIEAADRRLRQANERFELAAAAVRSAIYDWSLRHGTVVWTQGLTELCGYPLDEVGATHEWWIDRLHPADRARAQRQVEADAAGGAISRPSTVSAPGPATTSRCRTAGASCATARAARCAWSAP